MEGSQQLVEIVKQGTQQIMPVPIPELGISGVHGYIQPQGDLVHAIYKPYDHNRKNNNMQYCNFIPPAPRDPLVNVPYLGKDCPYDSDAKNKLGHGHDQGCFLVKNRIQNTIGFVCKDAGGTTNDNFVRSNDFALDYDTDVDGLSKSKKTEYTIENPVQLPIQMKNPIIKYDKSTTFYPTYLQSYNSFGKYPHASNYDTRETGGNIAKSIPTYVYPYKVINPHTNEPDVISLRNKDDFINKTDKNKGVVQEEEKLIIEFVENYGNTHNTIGMGENKYMSISQKYTTITIIFTILLLILILMLIVCKKIEIKCLIKAFTKFIKK